MMNSSEVAKRIEQLINLKGISGAELARRLGSDRSTVNRYFKGSRKIHMDDIPRFAEILEVDPLELLLGEKIDNLSPVAPQTVKIPILGEIACGEPILADANVRGYRYESPDNLPSGNLYFLEAKGDSMEPAIPNGSHVLIREQPSVDYGEIAAVLVNGDTEATLKRVVKQGEVILLMPINRNYEPIVVTKDNPARIIGKAIEVKYKL